MLAALGLTGCNDRIKVTQSYDFNIQTWPLPSQTEQGEEVEIRFTLRRDGAFAGCQYYFRWVQTEGTGDVYDGKDMFYTDRELYELAVVHALDTTDPYLYRFTLYYRSLTDDASSVRFIIEDNFGHSHDVVCEFRSK